MSGKVNSLVVPEPRGLGLPSMGRERMSSRLVGSGGPHFWSSMEASTADFLQGKLDD